MLKRIHISKVRKFLSLLLSLCVMLVFLAPPVSTKAQAQLSDTCVITIQGGTLTISENGKEIFSAAVTGANIWLSASADGTIKLTYRDGANNPRSVNLGQRRNFTFAGDMGSIILQHSVPASVTCVFSAQSNFGNIKIYSDGPVFINGKVKTVRVDSESGVNLGETSNIDALEVVNGKCRITLAPGAVLRSIFSDFTLSNIKGRQPGTAVHPLNTAPLSSGGGSGSDDSYSGDNGSPGNPGDPVPENPTSPSNDNSAFLSLKSNTADILIGTTETVVFFAEVRTGHEPPDGEVYAYDADGNLICALRDDAQGYDAINGDNVFTGHAVMSSNERAITSVRAVIGGEPSEPVNISFYPADITASAEYQQTLEVEAQIQSFMTQSLINAKLMAASGEINYDTLVIDQMDTVENIFKTAMDVGAVELYERYDDEQVIVAEFSSGIVYVWMPQDGQTNNGGNPDGEAGADSGGESGNVPGNGESEEPNGESEEPNGESEEPNGESGESDEESGESEEDINDTELLEPVIGSDPLLGEEGELSRPYEMINYAQSSATGRKVLSVVSTPDGSGYLFQTEANNAANNLVKSSIGFTHTSIKPYTSDSTIPNLRTALKGYDVIIWNGHGGYISSPWYAIVEVGEKYTATTDAAYSADLAAKRVYKSSSGNYAITAAFINDYYKSNDFPQTVFYFGGCKIGTTSYLADALISKGASAVMAYSNSVYTNYNRVFMPYVMQQLGIVNNTINQSATVNTAVAAAMKQYGEYDTSQGTTKYGNVAGHVPTKIIIYGDANYSIYKKSTVLAIENALFEKGFAYWTTSGDCHAIQAMGAVKPTNGNSMAMLRTGMGYIYPLATSSESMITRPFTVSKGQKLLLDYNLVSEEPPIDPNWVGTYEDTMQITVIAGGKEYLVKKESVSTSQWNYLGGAYFYGDRTATYQTGWKTLTIDFSLVGDGNVIGTDTPVTLKIHVWDGGDAYLVTAALISNLRAS